MIILVVMYGNMAIWTAFTRFLHRIEIFRFPLKVILVGRNMTPPWTESKTMICKLVVFMAICNCFKKVDLTFKAIYVHGYQIDNKLATFEIPKQPNFEILSFLESNKLAKNLNNIKVYFEGHWITLHLMSWLLPLWYFRDIDKDLGPSKMKTFIYSLKML